MRRCLLSSFAMALATETLKEAPKGHLEPFGGWMDGKPIEERTTIPEPLDFFNEYCNSDNGAGKPVVFRGAANSMKSSKWGTDDDILKKFAKEKVTGVEYNLKETRAGGNVPKINTMGKFLGQYNKTDIYMVSVVPDEMKKDVSFLPMLRCGGYLNWLDTNNMWYGRGGSKSVIHYDEQDNINCMISGKKRFVFMHPRYKKYFEAHPNTDKNKFGWVDTELDRKVKGYGAFMGKLDIDKMDLIKYPGWSKVKWSYVDLVPGDCLYLPYQWYHQVTAEPMRSINVHLWYFRPKTFDSKSCEGDAGAAAYIENPTALSDCTWGYEPRQGNVGFKEKKGKKPTVCKTSAVKKEEL